MKSPLWGFSCFQVPFLFAQGASLSAPWGSILTEHQLREIWSFMRLVLCLGLLFAGCASTSQVKVAVEVTSPKEAKSRSVAVVPDAYMEDPVEADKIAGLVRSQLTANGFKVYETENEAELVVIPTMERSKPGATGAAPLPRSWRSFDLSYGLGRGGMMESQNALQSLGFEFGSAPAPDALRAGLMVTAVTREAWFSALMNDKTEIPRVWRIVAVSPLKKEDVTSKLVEAVGSKLGRSYQREPSGDPSEPDAQPVAASKASAIASLKRRANFGHFARKSRAPLSPCPLREAPSRESSCGAHGIPSTASGETLHLPLGLRKPPCRFSASSSCLRIAPLRGRGYTQ